MSETETTNTPEIVVVNKYKSEFDVYIGRGSIWGNPFVIGRDGTREDVVRKYEEYLASTPALQKQLYLLRGKRLGCFCAPKLCHGHVLKRWAEGGPRLTAEKTEGKTA